MRPDDLDPEQRTLYDSIVSGPRKGGAFELVDEDGVLQGPFGGFLLSPPVGDALQRLGAAIRYRTSLSGRMRELAILLVAAHHHSGFERHAHEATGTVVGLTAAEMHAIHSGSIPDGLEPAELAVAELTRAMLAGDVDDRLWARCVPELGARTAYELLVLVGYYSTLALQMRVLRTDLPD
nr:carboxymuconolactone decarboxylase family protein [Flexivirga oryzae]